MPTAPFTPRLAAVLGPTNTGKTHYAVERMLGHDSGMIGFPLRLLAREIYDKVVAAVGPTRVALITGEEKIVPERAAYWICTAESMPMEKPVAFLGVDEIQLAGDPQRGHVFTDRILRARGSQETLLLGAETMRPVLKRLLPEIEFITRQRFSSLRYVTPVKLSRLPRRSAVVGFSADAVYGLAELVRRSRGGAAVVMGALSPRTRNAQVAMYQSGEVDYLVATDAIGMGLNMDIDHVAFAQTAKFDGRTIRDLHATEIAQIAGRAGRYMRDGSFSTVSGSDAQELDPGMITQIEEHRFAPVKALWWRNARLDMSTPDRLIRALEEPPPAPDLAKAPAALDLITLKTIVRDPRISDRATNPEAVRRLWEVCQIPDFRKISPADHVSLVKRLFLERTSGHGYVPHDWFAAQVSRLDNIQGDLDTLAARIASIRTWTYVAHRRGWLREAAHWAHVTRSVEDKLSDALHARLTQAFVDRRTSVLLRELRQKGSLAVSIDAMNEVEVEGHKIGRLEAFSFRADPTAAGTDFKTLQAAAERVLRVELARRAKIFANIGHKTLTLDFTHGLNAPRLMWQGFAIAYVDKGGHRLKPQVKLVHDALLTGPEAELVRNRAQGWLDERITAKLEPLLKLDEELSLSEPSDLNGVKLTGLARGIAFKLIEQFGVLNRESVAGDLKQVDQDARKGLRRFAIRIGATSLYQQAILKPHAVELRLMLWALWDDKKDLPEIPKPGLVTVPASPEHADFYRIAGFRVAGDVAVRIDMLERLADAVRPLGQGSKSFEVSPEIMGLVGCSGQQFAQVMRLLGYAHEVQMVSRAELAAQASQTEQAAQTEQADQTEQAAQAHQPEQAAEAHQTEQNEQAEQAGEQATDHKGREQQSDAQSSDHGPLGDQDQDQDQTAPAPDQAPAVPTGDAEAPAHPAITGDRPVEAGTEPAPPAEAPAQPTAQQGQVADAAPKAAAEPEPEMVERFVFTWAPRERRPRRPAQPRRKPSDGERPRRERSSKTEAGAPAKAERPGDHKPRAQARGQDGERRPPRGKAGPRGDKQRGGRKPDGPRIYRAEPEAKREKAVDADSPFAKLAELKARLEGKG